VPKRLRPLRGSSGGVLGGKALVALHLASRLAVAMATDPDGDTNEAKLVPDLLPQVQAHHAGVLWLAAAQFGNPAQAAAFTARPGDHFLVRDDRKTAFVRDPGRPVQQGQDEQGRPYVEEWGWWGGPRNRKHRYVRRITLTRAGSEPVVLLTDLLDAAAYPAGDLLALYLARWGIKRTLGKVKLLSRTVAQAHREAEGSLLALQLLLAHGALALAHDGDAGRPLPSARQVLREIRADLRDMTGMYLGPRQRRSYLQRLRRAQRPRWRRRRHNQVRRPWPTRKEHKPPKSPKFRRMGTDLKDLLAKTLGMKRHRSLDRKLRAR
jgi:hypothetical protein